jgi:hypothetical protein
LNFSTFILDEADGDKKKKEVISLIKKTVKKNLVDFYETEKACIIKFETVGTTLGGATIKPTSFEIIITLDYYKQVYRGMHRALYINIVKQTNSYKETDYIQLDIHDMSDAMYVKALDGIKEYFEKIVSIKKK